MGWADANGQPPSAINAARIADRAMDELIGACRLVLSDGAVSEPEAQSLLSMLSAKSELRSRWPADRLYLRLHEMLVDRVLDPEEQGELLLLLRDLVGYAGAPGMGNVVLSTPLPLCDPQPAVKFAAQRFCLTGKFIYGTRKQCQAEVLSRGGELHENPTNTTSYLVIGAVASRDWIHSSYGRKIEKAVELRSKGLSLRIVSEAHWTTAVGASG